MRRPGLLWIDASINLMLGVALLLFIPLPHAMAWAVGVPIGGAFYPSLLGAVFVGIGIALVWEAGARRGRAASGLGLLGACVINLCGGTVLMGWLAFGRLGLPRRGLAFLWGLAFVLVVLSGFELAVEVRRRNGERS
jgi:hypothetical protein